MSTPTLIPVKSSDESPPRASSPIPSGVTLQFLLGLDDLDVIAESSSGQPYTKVVNITSSPTYAAIALSNNERKSQRLTSDLSQRTRSGSQYWHISNMWQRKVKSWDDAPQKVICTSPEVTEAWDNTKERVSIAIKSVLNVSLDVVHELLVLGSDLLNLAPIPGLSLAARSLVESSVTLELQGPFNKLHEAFENVKRLFIEEAHRSFITRYLKRDDFKISSCNAEIRSALDMFNLSVSIRLLKQTQESERNRHIEIEVLLAAVSSPGTEPLMSLCYYQDVSPCMDSVVCKLLDATNASVLYRRTNVD